MLDTTNKDIRRVRTAQGEGTLMAIDPDTNKYQVQVSKKNATVEIQSPCVFWFYSAEELEEIKP